MSSHYGRGDSEKSFGAILGIGAVVAVIAVIVGAIMFISSFDRTDGGQIAVVRNGGVFDNNKIRQVIPPGSSLTWTGVSSKAHKYPAQQRFYTITSDSNRGDRAGVDVVSTPSRDGVSMGIEGTIYFTLNTDTSNCGGKNTRALQSQNPQCPIAAFDNKFGTRKFRGMDGTLRSAWGGDAGWSSYLDAIMRPVIDNDLRVQVNGFSCAQLVSSCALVQNAQTDKRPALIAGAANNTNIALVQNAVNTSLEADLTSMLGGKFFEGIKFNLSRVTLPPSVQESVNQAQAAYADISKAQAKVAQAQADAAANNKRQLGYNACPACAQIDIMKALPPNLQTFAPGSGFAVTGKR